MNAIELLTRDHQEATMLLDELENADTDQLETADENTTAVRGHQDTFRKLKNALTMHTQMEEQIFYPALEGFDETRALVEEAYQEHQGVDELLEELSALNPTDEDWANKIEELRENLDHHISEEENEMFPKAEEILGQEELQKLGRQMEQMKTRGAAATAGRTL